MNFATFLLGLRAQQPGEYRRLQHIRRRIFTKVADLRAEIVRSPEPIPFAELDRSAFRPFGAGQSWGRVFGCAWLRLTGDVPAGVTDPIVMLGIRGEGLVYTPGGELVDGVTTAFQQADLPHSAGRFRPVRTADLSRGSVELYADVTYNGWILYEVGRPAFFGAHLATRDDETYALYYDYLTLVVLAGATEDAALEAQLRASLRGAYQRFRRGDVAGARALLAVPLAAPSTSDFVYSAIGHGHLDMAWLWPLRETRRKAARTYVRAMNSLDEHGTIEGRPGYRYGTSQPQQMAWTQQRHPVLFDRMKKAVADGRMEIQGSFWVEPDTNLPSGESLVRQAVVGRRYLQETFGLTDEQMRLCWLPDTFGYNGNLPQILKGAGMDWFQTIKLAWNKVNDFPHRTFHWAGIDGSSVLVHMPPEGDYNSRGAADALLTGLKKYPERALNTALLVYGSGDGGGGPGEIHHEVTGREQGPNAQGMKGLPKVEYSTASAFFEHLETVDVEHTHHGELYLETHQGTYTTQGWIKRYNRIVERKLHEVEALAAIVGQRPDLEQLWREVLLNQFHDIIPGSSIRRVNVEAVETYERIESDLDAIAATLTASGDNPTATNLTSFTRHEPVKVNDTWFHAHVAPYASTALEPSPPAASLGHTANTLTNGRLSLTFGPTGEITSCVDPSGVEHAKDGLNRLVLFKDPYVWPFNAWDIKVDYFEKPPRALRVTSSESYIDGPTVVRHQVLSGPKVTVDQRIVLESGSDVVRFETKVDWHQKHHMLRAEFRPVQYADVVKCDIQFGHIDRVTTERDSVEKAQFEVCAHKWIAVEGETGGFALLNDTKYGHRAKNGLLSINLLRSPTFPDKLADRGHHEFTYAFTPFATGDLAKVMREGYRLNNPLIVGSNAAFESFATVDDAGVILETVKPTETGDGVTLRFYESLGKPTTTAVHLRADLTDRTATETDLLERPIGPGDLSALTFRPFEIKTIVLR